VPYRSGARNNFDHNYQPLGVTVERLAEGFRVTIGNQGGRGRPENPPHNYLAVIQVVGIGCGGVIVNRMIEQGGGSKGVEFIAINTTPRPLLMKRVRRQVEVGR